VVLFRNQLNALRLLGRLGYGAELKVEETEKIQTREDIEC